MAAHIVFFVLCLQVLLVQGDDSTICKDAGWTNGAHPYPYDCQHYVQCNGTLTIVHACSGGTFYDAAVRACLADNHGRPCLANQDLSTPPSNLDTTVCRQYGWASGIHPYPGDCNHYVYCVNSNTHIVVCPPGTSFDTRVNGCLDTSDAEPCQATTTTTTTTTTPAPTTTDMNTDANICSLNGWVSGIHPYPTDCSRYVYCVNSITHIVSCSPGTSFDTQVNGCLDTSDAEPCQATTTTTTTPAPTPTDVNTDPSNICRANNWMSGTHPHPTDCKIYVTCNNFVTSFFACPDETVFDPTQGVCVNPQFAAPPCNVITSSGRPEATSTLYATSAATHTPTVTTQRPVVTTHIFIPASPDMAGICNKFNLVDGIYPDPGACSKFVECVSANTYHMECPASLMFNSRLLVCDEAYDVVCTDNYYYNFQNIIIG